VKFCDKILPFCAFVMLVPEVTEKPTGLQNLVLQQLPKVRFWGSA